MKNNLNILLLFFLPGSLFAQFEPSLMLFSPEVYRNIRLEYQLLETDTEQVFESKKSFLFSGEYSFYKYYSISFGGSRVERKKTDTEKLNYFDRFRGGLKARKIWEKKLLTGIFFNGYSSQSDRPQTEDVNNTLFLLEGGFSIGYLFNKSQLIANIYMQTESNYQFNEEYGQQFRRFYQYELGYQYRWNKKTGILIETAYRQPYDSEIDAGSEFWYLYPGISYSSSIGKLGFSLKYPVKKFNREKGFRFSFIRFFKNIIIKAE